MKPNFFEQLSELKEILGNAIDPQIALLRVEPYLADQDVCREFWRLLSKPQWIQVLKQRGYFQNPTPAEKTYSGVRYPVWPQVAFLARMAHTAPDAVADILLSIETDNWSVARTAIDAVKVMPPAYAAKLVDKAIEWSQSGLLWHDLPDIADICVKLAAEPHSATGMRLIKSTFSIQNDVDKQSRRDEHWYIREIKDKLIPAYIKVRGRELIEHLVSELLKAMVADSHSGQIDPKESCDIMRPAIEEHPRNSNYNVTGKLIGCLRLALESGIAGKHLSFDDVMTILTPLPSGLKERFRIHLANRFADDDPARARHEIMANESLQVGGAKHEYARLVSDRFDLLEDSDKERWLTRVDNGPNFTLWKTNFRKWREREPSNPDAVAYASNWRFTRYHWVRKHLTGDCLSQYETLLQEIGDTRFTDMNVSVGWVGHSSPFSDAELAELTFEQLLDKVCTWKDKPNHIGSDLDGLANSFGKWVSERIETVSKEALKLAGRPAKFVSAYITQMAEGIKQRKKLPLGPTLELCEWVVQQDVARRTTPELSIDAVIAPDWQWTRDEISRLLELICEARVSEGSKQPLYPLNDHRESIWHLLLKLIDSPSKSRVVVDESKIDPRCHDFTSMAINSPRGIAMQAVIEYARWVGLHTMEVKEGKELLPKKFDTMPEVRSLIEQQIDPNHSSFEVMSILGSHFGLLLWIDDAWFETAADRICNLEYVEVDPRAAHGWGAWNTFLVWGIPHREYLRIFCKQYKYATAMATEVSNTEKNRPEPLPKLGEHLILLYGRGDLENGVENDFIQTMILRWQQPIRIHAMTVAGWTLQEQAKDIPEGVKQRFSALWDFYWSTTGPGDAKSDEQSRLFGSWFGSGVFDPKWSIDRLERFVEVVPKPEPDHEIVETLADIAEADLHASVRILDRLVKGDSEGWRVDQWAKHAYRLLEMAMANGGETRKLGEQIIDRLGRRGFMKFGDLLK